jgi:histidinol-phosphatase
MGYVRERAMTPDRLARDRLDNDLAFALELADLADEITRAHFQPGGFPFENKYDGTPVTAIDRAVEQAIRERVASRHPEDVVLGEEAGGGDQPPPPVHPTMGPLYPHGPLPLARERGNHGDAPEAASVPHRRRWIVDPIDGTRKFVRGIGIFATLIGLEIDGEIVVGVASAPLMDRTGRRWWAARGLGAFAEGRSIHVSTVARLADAHILHGSVEGWVRRGLGPTLNELSLRCWGTVGYGDFWIHLLVAEGMADAAVEPDAAIWDVAALKIIVEEAGGRFSDMVGQNTPAGGSGLSSNGLVHDEILAVLRGDAQQHPT